jgi:hypothetical protein
VDIRQSGRTVAYEAVPQAGTFHRDRGGNRLAVPGRLINDMSRYKHYLRYAKDHAADALLAVLQEQPTYVFTELFQAVHARLKANNVSNIGGDLLRFRIYEKLQTLVSEGLVNKTDKRYSGVQRALMARVDEIANSRALQQERKKVNMAAMVSRDQPEELPPQSAIAGISDECPEVTPHGT